MSDVAEGLGLAEQYALPYERAQLLLLRSELERARGDADAADGSAGEASSVLRSMGVVGA